MKNQDQEILQLLVLLTDYFDINVWFLVSKMRLKISRNLLRQISLVTLTVCSTSVMIILFMQQNKINICNSLKKFLIRYERKDWSLTLKSVNLVKFLLIKADSILNMKQPSNTSKVRSFLGLVTYCGKFIPNFAAITKPLRWLTRQKAYFAWNEKHESTYNKIKTFISKATVCS